MVKGALPLQLTAVQGVQEQTHAELSRLRAERDDALKELHEAQLEAKDLQARGETWKAAVSCVYYPWHCGPDQVPYNLG